MNDDERTAAQAAVTAKLQRAVLQKVADKAKTEGSSFSTAWSRLRASEPLMFDSLDSVNELSDEELQELLDLPLKTGQYEGQPFYRPLPDATARNNTPSGPNARPHNERSPDPRITPGMSRQNPARPRDARVIGNAWVRDLVSQIGAPVRVEAARGTIRIRNPHSWGDD